MAFSGNGRLLGQINNTFFSRSRGLFSYIFPPYGMDPSIQPFSPSFFPQFFFGSVLNLR